MKCAKLAGLRQILKNRGFDACLVANADPHGSECVAERFRKREWLTGFTGSNGVALVTSEKSLLWTDGRYTTQAAAELTGTPWAVRIQKLPGAMGITKEIIAWLEHEYDSKCALAIDSAVTSIADARALRASGSIDLRLWEGLSTENSQKDSFTEKTVAGIFPLSIKETGETIAEKCTRVTAVLGDAGLSGYLFSTLDDIAWLLNLRGRGDVPNAGVFRAYAVVLREAKTEAWALHVFSDIKESKLVKHFPADIQIKFHTYESAETWLAEMPRPSQPFGYSAALNYKLYEIIEKIFTSEHLQNLVSLPSVITHFRNRKNSAEIAGFRQCHVDDGVAVTAFLHWLETHITKAPITECEAADKLLELRRAHTRGFCQPSFDTISSTGPNSAIIHYAPKRGASATIQKNNIYLVDSGAHYRSGTTDITRTVFLGEGRPTHLQRVTYTKVLQGLVQVHMTKFPVSHAASASGFLDAIARKALWAGGADFPHGTGHGVGHGLSVHEGPMGIRKFAHFRNSENIPAAFQSFSEKYSSKALEPGVVLSNEPGCYLEGKFGVRIENIVCVRPSTVRPWGEARETAAEVFQKEKARLDAESSYKFVEETETDEDAWADWDECHEHPRRAVKMPPQVFAAPQFYELENFTLVPFCRRLIVEHMLQADEKAWVDGYHARVLRTIGPLLRKKGLKDAADWLKRECQPL